MATADYPMMLLSAPKRADYEKVVAYVRSKPFQEAMSTATLRRPIDPTAKAADNAPPLGLSDLPFPGKIETVEAIMSAFEDDLRRPTDSTFVVDISGSMEGARIGALKTALLGLAGADTEFLGALLQVQKP